MCDPSRHVCIVWATEGAIQRHCMAQMVNFSSNTQLPFKKYMLLEKTRKQAGFTIFWLVVFILSIHYYYALQFTIIQLPYSTILAHVL